MPHTTRSIRLGDDREGHVDTEDWLGLIVRARYGRALGVVMGTFADGPHVGCLRVVGQEEARGRGAWQWSGAVVYAIPRHAVMRRTRRSLVLDVTLSEARARWFIRFLRR